MRILPKNNLLKLLTAAVLICCVIFAINYFISIKINNDFYSKITNNSPSFVKSYKPIKIEYNSDEIDLYFLNQPLSNEYIIYLPDKNGISNSVINSIASKYNLIIIDYSSNGKFYSFEELKYIFELTLKSRPLQGIRSDKIIVFGEGIGGNIALSTSQNKIFKSVLILNILPDEKDYCKTSFNDLLCLMVKPSFELGGINKNLIYYFFNENKFTNADKNYQIFNSINAREKFLFEISGDSQNFSFNHIFEFYKNESLIQNEDLEYIEPEDDNSEVLDIDGLLNPDEYVD